MKIKRTIITVLITAIITASVSVTAVTLFAKDVGFTSTDEDWNVKNVEDAVNDLYELGNNKMLDEFVASSTSSEGERKPRSLSLSLTEGTYLVIGTGGLTSLAGESNVISGSSNSNTYLAIENDTGTCKEISAKKSVGVSQVSSVGYNRIYNYSVIWKCEFEENTNVTIANTSTVTESEVNASQLTVHTVKLK